MVVDRRVQTRCWPTSSSARRSTSLHASRVRVSLRVMAELRRSLTFRCEWRALGEGGPTRGRNVRLSQKRTFPPMKPDIAAEHVLLKKKRAPKGAPSLDARARDFGATHGSRAPEYYGNSCSQCFTLLSNRKRKARRCHRKRAFSVTKWWQPWRARNEKDALCLWSFGHG